MMKNGYSNYNTKKLINSEKALYCFCGYKEKLITGSHYVCVSFSV